MYNVKMQLKYVEDYRNEPRGPKKDDYGRSQGYNFYLKQIDNKINT